MNKAKENAPVSRKCAPHRVIRRKSDHDRHLELQVEFVGGGPLDGSRLWLDVVAEAPRWKSFRVLEARYEAKAPAGLPEGTAVSPAEKP